ncbi:MAG: TylF/MycF/NovP-related O-methyltransferase [Gemmatimonas sp.]
MLKKVPKRVASWLYSRALGFTPYFRRTHPRWPDVQPIMRALAAKPAARVLVVTSAHVRTPSFFRVASTVFGVEQILSRPQEAADPTGSPSYDFCIFDLDRNDLVERTRRLVATVLPMIADDGRIFIYCECDPHRDSTLARDLIDHGILASEMESALYFAGSTKSLNAMALFDTAIAKLQTRSPVGMALGFAKLLIAAASAWSENNTSSIVRTLRDSGRWSSLTLELSPKGYRASPADFVQHDYVRTDTFERMPIAGAEPQVMVDLERAFAEAYQCCKPFTTASVERLYMLFKSIEYLVVNRIPGAIIETGAQAGGRAMLAALALRHFGDETRSIVLFDSFEENTTPELWSSPPLRHWQQAVTENDTSERRRAPLAEVEANIRSTGYPADRVVFVKGIVEQTAAGYRAGPIGLLRLDTAWYTSTRATLEHMYPHIVPGGVLIIDGYGQYRGQRLAVDDYLAGIGEKPLLTRVDYSCRLALKTPARRGDARADA